MAKIYNTTIGKMVDVPDHQVPMYLADDRYQREAPVASKTSFKTNGAYAPKVAVKPKPKPRPRRVKP